MGVRDGVAAQVRDVAKEVQDIRFRRLEDAARLGLGALLGDHEFNGVVTMIFQRGELRYSLPDGARLK